MTRSDSTASGSQSSAGDRPSCSQGSARSNSPDRDDELHESSSSRVPNRPSVRFEHDDAEEERVRGDLALRGLPTTNDFVLFSTLLRHSSVIDEPFRMAIEVLGGMHANSAGEHARTSSGGMSSEEKARLRTDMRPVTKLLIFTPRWTTTHGTVFFDMLKWALERTKVIRPDVSNSSYNRDVKECLVKVLAEVRNDFTKLVRRFVPFCDRTPCVLIARLRRGTLTTLANCRALARVEVIFQRNYFAQFSWRWPDSTLIRQRQGRAEHRAGPERNALARAFPVHDVVAGLQTCETWFLQAVDPLDEVDPPAVDAVPSVNVWRPDVGVREPNALSEVQDCEVVAGG